MALRRSESVSLDVPRGVRTVMITASGARMSRMPDGHVVGHIDVPGTDVRRDIRIGDIADFGFMRRDQFLAARNSPPSVATDDIRGIGSTAWLYGAGRIVLSVSQRGSTLMRITAASNLPSDARLQIESIDFE